MKHGIGERGLRLMKMTEDPSQWDALFKEAREHRKTDPDCMAILAFCYYWGMGTFCDIEKCMRYELLVRQSKCAFAHILNAPYPGHQAHPAIELARQTNLKYFMLEIPREWQSKQEWNELMTYPPFLCGEALAAREKRDLFRYRHAFQACEPSGLHRLHLKTSQAYQHSHVDARNILKETNMILPGDFIPDLSGIVPARWIIGNHSVHGIRTIVEQINLLSLPIHHLELRIVLEKDVIDLIGQVNITKITIDCSVYDYDVHPAYISLFTELYKKFPNLRSMEFGRTSTQFMTPELLELFAPGRSSIRRLIFFKTTLSPAFRQILASNRALRVNDIHIDTPLLVLVNLSLSSLLPSWYPSQLRDLVLSQVWAQRKFELLGSTLSILNPKP